MDNSGKMNVVLFDKEAEDFEKNNIRINNLIKRRIKVLGTVTEYIGGLELILNDSKSLKDVNRIVCIFLSRIIHNKNLILILFIKIIIILRILIDESNVLLLNLSS
jgi:hypothetical protein